jgi:hypothetical protein
MVDFRDRIIPKTCHVPSDQAVIDLILCFGTRKICSYEELMKAYGFHNKERTDAQLERMCKEGKLTKLEEKGKVFYSIVRFET